MKYVPPYRTNTVGAEGYLRQIIPILKEAELAVKRLPEWMKDESCKRDAPLLLKGNSV